MNWDNVNVDAMPQRLCDYLSIWQFDGQAGKFMLELNILTGHAELWHWPEGIVTVKGPMDELINEAIELYSAHPFGEFAFFLRKCRCAALIELYFNPKYSKAVRSFKYE